MIFNESVMRDIDMALDQRDIPFFCGNYLFDGKAHIDGQDTFNMYPSKVDGDLKNFFLGICEGKDPLKNAFTHLLKWCRHHSENKTKGGLFGVVLTDKWDVNTFAQYEDALSLVKNTMPLKIAVVLVTEQGASLIKVLV